jgi:hypothetical protein
MCMGTTRAGYTHKQDKLQLRDSLYKDLNEPISFFFFCVMILTKISKNLCM